MNRKDYTATAGSRMADVSNKPVTRRTALAGGRIILGPEAFAQTVNRTLAKGDALAMAEIAAIQAAKLTPQLLPLCHPISLNRVAVRCHPAAEHDAIDVYCYAEIAERTGVEMEALTGLSVALLTIWDLTKPLNPALKISDTRLLFKSGGKNGDWQNPEGIPDVAASFLNEF